MSEFNNEIKDEDLILVRNMTDGTVVFRDEDTHRRFAFMAHEPKKIPAGILRRLYYSRGGQVLLQDYLCVSEPTLAREFGVPEDMIEYNWDEKKIDSVLTDEPIEVLLDALDFGPMGIRSLIAKRAIELEINDVAKRNAIFEKTGRNVTEVIKNKHDIAKAEEPIEPATPTRRRAAEPTVQKTGRRVAQPAHTPENIDSKE